MERVAFLLDTGERLGALLNPNTLVVRRVAGVRPRRSAGGQLTGAGLADDPLLYTGGGRTELDLDLLFDVEIAGSSITTTDVRDLTRPLWTLTENRVGADGYGRPPLVRFVWGKAWNIPGLVTHVAERLEYFTPEGSPQRSWLRLRMVRVSEPDAAAPPTTAPPPAIEDLEGLAVPPGEGQVHEIIGGGDSPDGGGGERLDELAYRYFGNAAYWRLIAAYNNLSDPTHVPAGTLLVLPPLPGAGS